MVAKRTVGIFSSYNASEKTFCALYLAEHILWRYKHVVWIVPEGVSTRSRYHGFSHKWDPEILSLKSQTKQVKEELADCEICFFFDESEQLFSLLPKETKTIVFLDPHKWTESSRSFVKKCSHSFSVSPHITNTLAQRNLLENTLFCPFDHSLQMIPKVGITSGTAATLFYPAYDMTFLERQSLQQVSSIVKKCCPDSKSVIGYYDTSESSKPGRDARTYDWRLIDYLKQTDWIVDLNPRPLMGLFSAFAGALCSQWSCFDIPPNTDSYSAARRHVIPYPKEGLTVANAENIATHLVRQLNTSFSDDASRNKGAGSYVKRLDGFKEAMDWLFKKKKKKRRSSIAEYL